MNDKQIAAFNKFDKQLADFQKRYDGVVYDLSDPKEDKAARSDRYKIGQVISALDETHKKIKAPLAEKVAIIDKERKRIKDKLLELQEGIKTQIEKREQEIAITLQSYNARLKKSMN